MEIDRVVFSLSMYTDWIFVKYTFLSPKNPKKGISTKTSNLIFVSVATHSLYYYVCKKVITVLNERGLTERTCISQTSTRECLFDQGVLCLSCLCKVIKIKTGGVSMQTDTTSQNTPSVYHFIVLFVSAILSSTVQFSCKLELLQVEYLVVRLFVIACNFLLQKIITRSLEFISQSLSFVIIMLLHRCPLNSSKLTLHLQQ